MILSPATPASPTLLTMASITGCSVWTRIQPQWVNLTPTVSAGLTNFAHALAASASPANSFTAASIISWTAAASILSSAPTAFSLRMRTTTLWGSSAANGRAPGVLPRPREKITFLSAVKGHFDRSHGGALDEIAPGDGAFLISFFS